MDLTNEAEGPRRRALVLRMLVRFMLGMAVIGAILFASAGSLAWARGWRFLAALTVLMAAIMSIFVIRDPALIERRLLMRERRGRQRLVISLAGLILVPIFVLPGIDWRLGWSSVPEAVSWAGIAAMALGFALFFLVMRANSYASRVVEIQEGQKVIDRGPYAVVRHPMYSSMMIFYLASPLTLGSWWALIPAAAYLPVMMLRVRDEEAMLRAGLPGYVEYCAKVRRRMIPGIW
jgi:protein-S-isoprenylcysteine O-methyltransferase Ste14